MRGTRPRRKFSMTILWMIPGMKHIFMIAAAVEVHSIQMKLHVCCGKCKSFHYPCVYLKQCNKVSHMYRNSNRSTASGQIRQVQRARGAIAVVRQHKHTRQTHLIPYIIVVKTRTVRTQTLQRGIITSDELGAWLCNEQKFEVCIWIAPVIWIKCSCNQKSSVWCMLLQKYHNHQVNTTTTLKSQLQWYAKCI